MIERELLLPNFILFSVKSEITLFRYLSIIFMGLEIPHGQEQLVTVNFQLLSFLVLLFLSVILLQPAEFFSSIRKENLNADRKTIDSLQPKGLLHNSIPFFDLDLQIFDNCYCLRSIFSHLWPVIWPRSRKSTWKIGSIDYIKQLLYRKVFSCLQVVGKERQPT